MGNGNMPYKLVGPIEEAKSVTIAYLHLELEPILAAQGCKITRGEKTWNAVTLVEYPSGCKRQEVFGRAQETRLMVTFPHGFQLMEVENRKGECVALYIAKPVDQ